VDAIRYFLDERRLETFKAAEKYLEKVSQFMEAADPQLKLGF